MPKKQIKYLQSSPRDHRIRLSLRILGKNILFEIHRQLFQKLKKKKKEKTCWKHDLRTRLSVLYDL